MFNYNNCHNHPARWVLPRDTLQVGKLRLREKVWQRHRASKCQGAVCSIVIFPEKHHSCRSAWHILGNRTDSTLMIQKYVGNRYSAHLSKPARLISLQPEERCFPDRSSHTLLSAGVTPEGEETAGVSAQKKRTYSRAKHPQRAGPLLTWG